LRKLLLPILLIIAMMPAGCTAITPTTTQQPPTAYIDSISPSEALDGEPITFIGHGTDPSSTVVAHRWRSSIDGEFSVLDKFSKTSLSEGNHTIYYKVQNGYGLWSSEVYQRVTITPSGNMKPIIKTFDADMKSIIIGKSATLSWNISGATSVSIDPDIGNVAMTGTRIVSPASTTVYTLTATNAVGTISAELQVVVGTVPQSKLELYSIASEEGYVRSGGFVGQEVIIGENQSNVMVQGFLSFDISMIPPEATIESVSLDITNSNISGDPFTTMGLLMIYNHQYGVLQSRNFILGPGMNPLAQLYSPPNQPIEGSALLNAVKTQMSEKQTRFQLRLQFAKVPSYSPSYGRGPLNYLELPKGKTKLTIRYK